MLNPLCLLWKDLLFLSGILNCVWVWQTCFLQEMAQVLQIHCANLDDLNLTSISFGRAAAGGFKRLARFHHAPPGAPEIHRGAVSSNAAA